MKLEVSDAWARDGEDSHQPSYCLFWLSPPARVCRCELMRVVYAAGDPRKMHSLSITCSLSRSTLSVYHFFHVCLHAQAQVDKTVEAAIALPSTARPTEMPAELLGARAKMSQVQMLKPKAESLASAFQHAKYAHDNAQKDLEKVTRDRDHFDEGPRRTPQSGLPGTTLRARLRNDAVWLLREFFAVAEAASLAEERVLAGPLMLKVRKRAKIGGTLRTDADDAV
eukprot:6178065-Pleurochrysis_carterae.AAC.1